MGPATAAVPQTDPQLLLLLPGPETTADQTVGTVQTAAGFHGILFVVGGVVAPPTEQLLPVPFPVCNIMKQRYVSLNAMCSAHLVLLGSPRALLLRCSVLWTAREPAHNTGSSRAAMNQRSTVARSHSPVLIHHHSIKLRLVRSLSGLSTWIDH